MRNGGHGYIIVQGGCALLLCTVGLSLQLHAILPRALWMDGTRSLQVMVEDWLLSSVHYQLWWQNRNSPHPSYYQNTDGLGMQLRASS